MDPPSRFPSRSSSLSLPPSHRAPHSASAVTSSHPTLMTPGSCEGNPPFLINSKWAGSVTPVKGSPKGKGSHHHSQSDPLSQLHQVPLQPRIERAPARNSQQLSQVESDFKSPTTTDYLYGSQNSNQPVHPSGAMDPYSRELQEEAERLDKSRNPRSSSARKSRRGAWGVDLYDEDTSFQSPQARNISNIVGDDLGDVFRHEDFDALPHTP
jgi:hypothetical protein